MDVSNSKFVASRVIKLPPGFRFKPTDEELVVQYLKRKALGCPLPASVIPEINLSKYDPWDLPGDLEKEKYFFSRREAKYLNGDRCNRASGSGYWKATGIDKQIVSSRSNQTVAGMKKTLVFYRGKPPAGCKTEWIMHEYRLVSSSQNSNLQMENWVVCRIFLKKRRRRDEDESQLESRVKPHFIDFMMLLPPPSTSYSCSASSGITEVSDHEENSPK